ncbi:hypothetical protein [Massilia litorea]|jgi:hypothetical protein|uniref:Uncharacterized protein n=1 Tax=Massilia litorea TaxID=2769491 RepID=A0A7L9U3N3_9BURK|nr:hypothetical protein [Massilia litorea]QOL48636.1 hypothetical protein LPB04_16935 [Massilia litorea]
MTVKVYRYAQYAFDHDENLSHGYATMGYIVLNKLTAIPDSEMDVDPAHVDEEGRYLGLNGSRPA